MGLESEFSFFSGELDEPQALTAQEKFTEKVSFVVDEAFAHTPQLSDWTDESKLILWDGVNDALTSLHERVGGRLSRLSCTKHQQEGRDSVFDLLVVETGEPSNILFNTEDLIPEDFQLPRKEALRWGRMVFKRSFDMLTSNHINMTDFKKMRDASRKHRGVLAGASSHSHRSHQDQQINPR